MSEKAGWIAVDLDGTLAEYHGWVSEEHIGEPIQEMAKKVRGWIAEGKDVRIFTARADGGEVAIAMGNPEGAKFRDIGRITTIIQDWTEKHFGVRLPVTNKKDCGMVELWDDRCKQVEPNTGIALEDVMGKLVQTLEGLARVCTCDRPAIVLPDNSVRAPGPHTDRCVLTRAKQALSATKPMIT